MKKAKIALTAIAVLGTLGSALAFKAIKRSVNVYFTTTVAGATATLTLTHAITVPVVSIQGTFKYFTTIEGDDATAYSKVYIAAF